MSHSFIAVANIVNGVDLDTFPAWLRITHFINFIMMGFLIRSGWEVLASHPRLYWNNHCTPPALSGSSSPRTRFQPSPASSPLATISAVFTR